MEAGGDNIVWFTYTGEEGEDIPDEATHVFVAVKVVRARAFFMHPNVVEVTCHEDVEKIEGHAFSSCRFLRQVIMPGVKIVESMAFYHCKAMTDVECGKLEIIGKEAFNSCKSLRSINLPSARIIELAAFFGCKALMDAKFGSKLERIDGEAFWRCTSLERITIPFKNRLIHHDNAFEWCGNLNRVNLVEGGLHEIIAALQLEDWRNKMYEEIHSINKILPNVDVRTAYYNNGVGGKAMVIRAWIGSVLRQLVHYKAEHRLLLGESFAHIFHLPRDIVMKNVLPFLELPSNAFE